MDSNIFSLVKTRDDVDTLVGEIDILLDSLHRTGDADFDHILGSKVRSSTAQFLASKKLELPGLKTQLSQAKIIKLTLALQATNALAEKITTWLRKNIDPNVVLELDYDRNIIAGAIIEYQGKYADLSLNKKLHDLNL